jgi:SecD/SecF fusion protein
MSRTILTSGTVFIVVTVLYFFGGPGIHAFAFSLVIGVISGTYSTVFIAAPLLLWMFKREQAKAGVRLEGRATTKSVA